MNILVTGANGQLGKEIKKAVDAIGNGHPDHDSSEKNYYLFATRKDLDITDESAVKEFVHKRFINVIINCAAYTNVERAQRDRDAAYNINALGPLNLALAAKEVGAVLIHISTDYVFSHGTPAKKPLPPVSFSKSAYDEYLPVEMDKCYYGYSKLVGEDLIEQSGCKYLIFRTSWLYSSNEGNFVSKMFGKSESNLESNVVVDQVGSPTNAEDLAKFLVRIIEENNAENRYLSKTGIYNFCNAGVASWYDLANAVYLLEGFRDKLVCPCFSSDFDSAVFRPSYSVLDFRKTKDTFNEIQKNWFGSLSYVIDEIKERRRKEKEAMEAANSEWEYGHNIENPRNKNEEI